MQNPFTAEVLLKQTSFNQEIEKIKDSSMITLMAEALVKNPISYHNFLKFAKHIKHNFFIDNNFDNELKTICEKSINNYDNSRLNTNVIVKKLNIVLHIKDIDLKRNLFMNFANELFQASSDLKNQSYILSGWKKINSEQIDKIHHLIPDIIAPQKNIQINEINYCVIKLDSYHIALDYGVNNNVIEVFLNNFICFLNKNSPDLINHIKISENKRNTDIYILGKDKANLFVDFLQHCLSTKNFTCKTKNLDVILNKIKLETCTPEKSNPHENIKNIKI